MEKMYKTAEIADMFGVTRATVRVWINDGTLRAVKIGKGKYWRVPESAAVDLANQRHGAIT